MIQKSSDPQVSVPVQENIPDQSPESRTSCVVIQLSLSWRGLISLIERTGMTGICSTFFIGEDVIEISGALKLAKRNYAILKHKAN
jgi:hypothetical protein